MDKYLEENKLALAYFGNFSGDLWDAYSGVNKVESIADMYDFYHTSDTSCGTKYGLDGAGVLVHRSFEPLDV